MNNIRSSKNVPSFLSSNKSLLQKWKHNLPSLIRTAVFILIVSSCSTPTVWSYTPNSYVPSDRKILLKTVSIPPFEDERPNRNDNFTFAAAIPLMPYGWADYEKPEKEKGHLASKAWINYRPTDDFAKALAEEVKNAGIIKETLSELRKEDQYYIRGTILNTGYRGKMFSYGLASLGPLLWYLGAPAVKVENDLSLEMNLLNQKTGKILFAKKYSAVPISELGWIYSLPDDFRYSEMLREIYGEFIHDLNAEFPSGLKE